MSRLNFTENETDDVTKSLPHSVGGEKSVLSSILQEPKKYMKEASQEGLEQSDFYLPATSTLFFILNQIHEEGEEIELVSLSQRLLDNGLMSKIGGPGELSAIYGYSPSNTNFQRHLQIVKDKAVLRQVIRNANAQVAAAYDAPDEVTEIVEMVDKQLSKVKQKTESRASDYRRYRKQIVASDELKEGVSSYLNGDTLMGGAPFFLPDFKLQFRPHEFTLVFGHSGHGKSQAVQNMVANLVIQGHKCFIASFEQTPAATFAQILVSLTGDPNISQKPDYDDAYDWLSKRISMYKEMKRTCPKHLIQSCRQAHINDGIGFFVTDNVMTLNIDRSDNTAQAAAADHYRLFGSELPVHNILVAHPRKAGGDAVAKNGGYMQPPSLADINGAGEWGNMPNNALVVWRDMQKADQTAQMENDGRSESDIKAFWKTTPCGKFITRKQRATGDLPMASYWFDKNTKRFMTTAGMVQPMYDEAPWELKQESLETNQPQPHKQP